VPVAFWAFTAPRALGSVAQIALQRLDIVLIAALAGPVQAAVYTAATRFLVFGQLGGQALSTGVQHRFGTLLAVGDRAGAAELYRTATAWLVVLTWPLYLLFALYAPFVLAIFGPGYAAGQRVMVLLALTMLVATGCGMVDIVLNMAGRTTWTLANAGLALTMNVALNLLLIPPLGILGAAIAWAAAIAVNNLLPLAQLGLSLGLHPFGPGIAAAAGLAVLCFGLVPGTAVLAFGRSLPVLVGATVLGTGVYGLGLWAARGPLRLSALRALRRGRA
jgi:O-antigen/teichoic acid export membrane protein